MEESAHTAPKRKVGPKLAGESYARGRISFLPEVLVLEEDVNFTFVVHCSGE